jgi:oxygen-independent coproporphyrinogen-3 oxidase
MIYIHIPYCKTKCVYCSFYSIAGQKNTLKYTDALCSELKTRKNYLPSTEIRTIYFGGGTPSVLEISSLKKIIQTLRDNYDLQNIEEITFEANPEHLTAEYLKELKSLNFINRLSIGVQTFDDKILKLINRRHTSKQALEAVRIAQAEGFNNISLDLIYGIPTQGNKEWNKNLDTISELAIQHLSCYALTVEPDTMLEKMITKNIIPPVSEDYTIEQYSLLEEWAEKNGFIHYEISNFTKGEEYRGLHNSRYWNNTPYLGCGASAHSFDGENRGWNPANINTYIQEIQSGKLPFETEILTPKDRYNDYIMTTLRTKEGINSSFLESNFATLWDVAKKKIKHFENRSLIEKTSEGYKLTKKGILMCDFITVELFAD